MIAVKQRMEKIKGWCWSLLRRDENNDGPKTIPIYFVFFFVLNYTMGTGFLGIPFAFHHSGIITAALTLLSVSSLSYVGAMWLIETMARAQVLTLFYLMHYFHPIIHPALSMCCLC